LNPFTRWYSVHGVGFLSTRKGSGFVTNQGYLTPLIFTAL
jgi:hypothetical protein